MLVLSRMSRYGDPKQGAARGRRAAPGLSLAWCLPLCLLLALSLIGRASADLYDHLISLPTRTGVGDPSLPSQSLNEGPKGLASGDFDRDGSPDLATSNLDGSVSVLYTIQEEDALSGFLLPSVTNLRTDALTLRGLVAGDFDGNGYDDLAAAAPHEGKIHLFSHSEDSSRNPVKTVIDAWVGVRSLATGHFDHDGILDLAAAGPSGDLDVAVGVRIFRGLASGGFEAVQDFPELNVFSLLDTVESEFPGPHYVLRAFRWPGNTTDSLVVSHVWSQNVWQLEPNPEATNLELSPVVLLLGVVAHDIDVAMLDGEAPALILSSKVRNEVAIFLSNPDDRLFNETPLQVIPISDGPRAVRALDVIGDDRLDLAVALRNADSTVLLESTDDGFVPKGSYSVGRSPRAIEVGDWNKDGVPDLALINRISEDIAVLVGAEDKSGFLVSSGVVPVSGEIADLEIGDLNADDYGELMVLLRGGGDLLVFPGTADGPGATPAYYPTGFLPSQIKLGDVNGDGREDVSVAMLIDSSRTHGGVHVRLGMPDGSLGDILEVKFPEAHRGKILSIQLGDLTDDDRLDLVAAYVDARIGVFEGIGNGFFLHRRTLPFVNGSRELKVADFDNDGDNDVVGAGYYGEVCLLENRHKERAFEFRGHQYSAKGDERIGAREMGIIIEDGLPQLLLGTNRGIHVFRSGPLASFGESSLLPLTEQKVVSGMAVGDFDSGGDEDIAFSCLPENCLTLLVGSEEEGNEEEPFIPWFEGPVPESRHLAVGDIDGDNIHDLAGAGDGFWFALSNSPVGSGQHIDLDGDPFGADAPVINEILAKNDSISILADGGRESDFVEIFNASRKSVKLSGWTMRYTKLTDEGGGRETWDYVFPDELTMESGTHLILVCRTNRSTVFHTGFPLARKSGLLELLDEEGNVVDRVEYGEQVEDVSFARVKDGLRRFVANYLPDPGEPNFGSGEAEAEPTPPEVALLGLDASTVIEDTPLRITARSTDNTGVAAMSVIYRVSGSVVTGGKRAILFDDGLHGDGLAGDGVFGGVVGAGFPEGTELEFYLESVDLDETIRREPSNASFAKGADPSSRLKVLIGGGLAGLELSEAVAANDTGLVDETGLPGDWVEIRNSSSRELALNGVELTQSLVQPGGSVFRFPPDAVLRPGEYLIVFLDRNVSLPFHAPFRLSASKGEELVLRRVTATGAAELIDSLSVPPLGVDESYARLGREGGFVIGEPTPGRQNLEESITVYPVNGDTREVVVVFRTERGPDAVLEEMEGTGWKEVRRYPGIGVERSVRFRTTNARYFRVRMD